MWLSIRSVVEVVVDPKKRRLQTLTVGQHMTVLNLYLIASKACQPFDEGALGIVGVTKDHDIAAPRFVKPVDKFIHENPISFKERWVHGT